MGVLRLFLAMVVATDHWRVLVLSPHDIYPSDVFEFGFNAGYAVMFFYIISGFLITYTLVRNYSDDHTGVLRFYRNRFTRIFSLYWPLILISFVVVPSSFMSFKASSIADELPAIFLIGMDWKLAFTEYPELHWPATIDTLHQSWTLGAEMIFYVMAPWLLKSWRMAAVLLVASLTIRLGFVLRNGNDVQVVWTYLFFGSTCCFFMIGHLMCRAAAKFEIMQSSVFGLIFVGLSFIVMVTGRRQGFDSLRFWQAVCCFAIGLPGFFEATRSFRVMNWFGELSYPLYLTHLLVFVLWSDVLRRTIFGYFGTTALGGYLSLACFLAITLVVAAIAHLVIERPIAYFFRAEKKNGTILAFPRS